jgi:ubiquinone/menaquinone biosynthesis C-methylase UbiE
MYNGVNCSKKEIIKSNNSILKAYETKHDDRISEVVRMLEGEKILDVGCGYGTISRWCSEQGYKMHGIDRVEEFILIAKEFNENKNVNFEKRDFMEKKFPADSFDGILFLETIEHVENPAEYIKEFHRILKPNGILIISTPNATALKNMLYALSYRKKEKRESLIQNISNEPKNTGDQLEHIYNWDFPCLSRLVNRCGFNITDHSFVGSGPIFLPIFGKRIRMIRGNSRILNKWPPLMKTQIIKCKKL